MVRNDLMIVGTTKWNVTPYEIIEKAERLGMNYEKEYKEDVFNFRADTVMEFHNSEEKNFIFVRLYTGKGFLLKTSIDSFTNILKAAGFGFVNVKEHHFIKLDHC